jgi:hypothetical protein
MRFPKTEVQDGLESFLKACENTASPLVLIPLVYKSYKALKAKYQLKVTK